MCLMDHMSLWTTVQQLTNQANPWLNSMRFVVAPTKHVIVLRTLLAISAAHFACSDLNLHDELTWKGLMIVA